MFEGRILPLHQYILEQAKLSGTVFNYYIVYTISYMSNLRLGNILDAVSRQKHKLMTKGNLII